MGTIADDDYGDEHSDRDHPANGANPAE